MDGLWWKTLLRWMIWGTIIFGNTHMVVKNPKIVVSQEGFLLPSSFLVYITLFFTQHISIFPMLPGIAPKPSLWYHEQIQKRPSFDAEQHLSNRNPCVPSANSKYYCLRDCKQKLTALFLLDEFWDSKPLISRRNSQASRGTSVFGGPEAHTLQCGKNCGFILNPGVLSSFFQCITRKPLHMKEKKPERFTFWDLMPWLFLQKSNKNMPGDSSRDLFIPRLEVT